MLSHPVRPTGSSPTGSSLTASDGRNSSRRPDPLQIGNNQPGQLARGNYDYDQATPDSDPAFLERIAVKYLRHELSDYDPELAKLFGQVGRADATSVVRKHVYNAIADAYPDLATECARQLRDRARYIPLCPNLTFRHSGRRP
jgi:hypothetical protein